MNEITLDASVAAQLQDLVDDHRRHGAGKGHAHGHPVARIRPGDCHPGQFSVLGVPLTLDAGTAAALNVFSPAPDVFDAAAVQKAELFASHAEKALRLAVRIGVRQQLAEDLRSAMESRTAIDLAAGIIMAQNRCSQAEVMAILTKASSGRNQKLRDMAERLVGSFAVAVKPLPMKRSLHQWAAVPASQ